MADNATAVLFLTDGEVLRVVVNDEAILVGLTEGAPFFVNHADNGERSLINPAHVRRVKFV